LSVHPKWFPGVKSQGRKPHSKIDKENVSDYWHP
jgi:hypothetical protein